MHKIGLLPGHKWVRFFRWQMAVKQTAKNRARVAQGLKPMGRPVPRLVSIDFEDAYMVPANWRLDDARHFALYESLVPYFAIFIDGEYFAIPGGEVPLMHIQKTLDAGRIMVLPMEGIYKW